MVISETLARRGRGFYEWHLQPRTRAPLLEKENAYQATALPVRAWPASRNGLRP